MKEMAEMEGRLSKKLKNTEDGGKHTHTLGDDEDRKPEEKETACICESTAPTTSEKVGHKPEVDATNDDRAWSFRGANGRFHKKRPIEKVQAAVPIENVQAAAPIENVQAAVPMESEIAQAADPKKNDTESDADSDSPATVSRREWGHQWVRNKGKKEMRVQFTEGMVNLQEEMKKMK